MTTCQCAQSIDATRPSQCWRWMTTMRITTPTTLTIPVSSIRDNPTTVQLNTNTNTTTNNTTTTTTHNSGIGTYGYNPHELSNMVQSSLQNLRLMAQLAGIY